MADDLDTTQLIGEVHKKPLLYSKSDQDYLNKAKKDQTWERIAAKFRTTGTHGTAQSSSHFEIAYFYVRSMKRNRVFALSYVLPSQIVSNLYNYIIVISSYIHFCLFSSRPIHSLFAFQYTPY